ncbi:MAG: DUF2203 family protein [Myxococcales bacterium]|nr:DUF2203 family protein [Myxococcales bacterium]
MADTRYFTVDEANTLVPRLEGSFNRMMQLRGELRRAGAELERMGEQVDPSSLASEEGPPELRSTRGRVRGLLDALSDELSDLEEIGVQVKDLDTGLCDLVARHDGRDVLLCWRLGEKHFEFWHELEGGFSGRRPIDQTFERTLH